MSRLRRIEGDADAVASPFGPVALGPESQRTTTIADAVRRCRWIAVDLNAAGFSLFLAARSVEMLAPCFDSHFPDLGPETQLIAGRERTSLFRHLRSSTIPCWWSDDPAAASVSAFEALEWTRRIDPLAPHNCGIGFPVQADPGLCGLVVFYGEAITLTPDGLYDIHARCYSLFDAVARIRSGAGGTLPSISKREIECLKLTANGYTSEQIARLLKLSVHTTNQYLASSALKLNAVNRMQAVAKALRLGLIE